MNFGGSDFVASESGFVELRDDTDVLDRVAWGDDMADGDATGERQAAASLTGDQPTAGRAGNKE